MKYAEYENAIFRTESERFGAPMDEVLAGGRWIPARGLSRVKAAIYGASMTEEEAKNFAGEDWPRAGGTVPGPAAAEEDNPK